MEIFNTSDLDAHYLKVLVYGNPKVGKTTLVKTLPNPIVLSAEAGLLSLKGEDVEFIKIKKYSDMEDGYRYIKDNMDKYDWVVIDSISDVAETVLADMKDQYKDGRQAYGETNDIVLQMIKAYRNLDINIYFSAKMEKSQDASTGGMIFAPSMPGRKMTQDLPYLFDEVFVLHNFKDENGKTQRAFQTSGDNKYIAGDRSGQLDMAEPADLSVIYNKIFNNLKGEKS